MKKCKDLLVRGITAGVICWMGLFTSNAWATDPEPGIPEIPGPLASMVLMMLFGLSFWIRKVLKK